MGGKLCGLGEVTPATRNINRQIQKQKKEMDDSVKLLLLGTGGSGKSTIAKQMKIIYMNGFDKDELEEFKKILHNNTINSIKLLIKQANEWSIEITKTNKTHASFVMDSNAYRDAVTPEMVPHIKALWKDPGIQQVFNRGNEFPLPSSCKYCMENIETIARPDYVPDVMDVLNARQRTTGVLETVFFVDDLIFTMVDVGGQKKNERRKWIHCFENVTAVIYCVGLSDYDSMMVEDSTTNMMHDSLTLFEDISNNQWFKNTNIILFLNKHDLFKEKAARVDMKICYTDYDGGVDPERGLEYIKNKFLNAVHDTGKKKKFIHMSL